MSNQKRSKHKISIDEVNAERFLNKIPSALLELQKRGFLLPKKEQLEVGELINTPNSSDEEQKNDASLGGQVLNVFERHEQRLSNALTGIYKSSVKNSSSLLSQTNLESKSEISSQDLSSAYDQTRNSLSSTYDQTRNSLSSAYDQTRNSLSSVYNQTSNDLDYRNEATDINSFATNPRKSFQEPQKMLSLLSSGTGDKFLGEKGTLNFNFPDFKTQQPEKANIQIGKLVEQVNIHAQDVSEGSQQMVKVLKEKLVEILQDELDTRY